MSRRIYTEDEIVAYLSKTTLPTVLVEGSDDILIYRWLENKIGVSKVNFLPCSGRQTLLNIYNRKNEYHNAVITFIADKDMYCFTSPPTKYNKIIWTSGYSIENDLYYSGSSIIINLLDLIEKNEFKNSLEKLLVWYAFEIEQFLSDNTYEISFHINQIFLKNSDNLDPDFLKSRNYTEPYGKLLEQIKTNYALLLRGKYLFQLIFKCLSNKNRKSKYSYYNLYELCLKLAPDLNLLEKIMNSVKKNLKII